MNYSTANFRAIIIAGGQGKRIRHLSNRPKCLFKYQKKTLLEIIYNNLKKNNINDITLISNYKYNLIKNLVNHKLKNIKLIKEDFPLGTGGCLSLLKKNNKKDLLLIFGDLLFDFNFKRILKFHKKKKSDLTILVHPNSHPYDSDLIIKDANSKLLRILKKPHRKGLFYNNLVSMGIFVMNRKLLNFIKNKKK